MSRFPTRRLAIAGAATAVVLAVLAAVASAGSSPITKARLERSLPQSFSRLYVQQAALLGHRGITVASLQAKASCDKGGPKVPDVGPGADWICQMAFQDPNVPIPGGTAKFELSVHSNGCYTAGGPSKFVGQLTITDARGRTVDNPVFEWDACLDPHADDAPTGNDALASGGSSATPEQQAAQSATVTLPKGTMATSTSGTITPSMACSAGKDGCAGTVTATIAGRTITADYIVAPDSIAPFTLHLPAGVTGPLALEVSPVIGTAPQPTSTITLVPSRHAP